MTLDALKECVATALSVDAGMLKPDTRLDSLPEFDSVARLGLVLALDENGVPVPMERAADLETFGDIMRIAGIN